MCRRGWPGRRWARRGSVSAVTTTPPLHVRLAFCLLNVRPRPEWQPWAESVVSAPRTWPWIVGARVGFGLTTGAVLLVASGLCGITTVDRSFVFGVLLVMLLVLVPLAVSLNDDERARRREVARIYGTRRRGPALVVSTTVSSLYTALLLVTDFGRRWSGPLLDRVSWAAAVAILLTVIWFFHERRVLDRELDTLSGKRPEST